jgi:ElaB/YqjD/DUF883 family membrane-anchored ribosome-binding protein
MADFKLSTERFDEIKTLISENPTKAEKSIKKAELLDFISDSAEKVKTENKKEVNKIKSELKQQSEYLTEANKKNEKLCKEITDLKNQVITEKGYSSISQTNFEGLIKKLNVYRFICIALIIVVILQSIF